MSGVSIVLPELEAGRRRSSLVGAPAVAGDDYPSAIDLKFSVDIVNTSPRQAAGSLGLKSYTVYDVQVRVLGTDRVWAVQRRYNEFLRLYRALQDGVLNYPSFPPKKFFGNMDPEFIRQRSAGLTRFLQAVLDLPHIATKHPEIDIFFGFRSHLHGLRTALSQEMSSPAQGVPSSPPGAFKRRSHGERRGSGSTGMSPGGLQGSGTSPLGRGTPTRLFTPPPYVSETNTSLPTLVMAGKGSIQMDTREEERKEPEEPKITVVETVQEKTETKTPVIIEGAEQPARPDLLSHPVVTGKIDLQENVSTLPARIEAVQNEPEIPSAAVLPEPTSQELSQPLPPLSQIQEDEQIPPPHTEPSEHETVPLATPTEQQTEIVEHETLSQSPPPPPLQPQQDIPQPTLQPTPTSSPQQQQKTDTNTPPVQEPTQTPTTHTVSDTHNTLSERETIEDAEGTPSLPLEGEDTFVVLPEAHQPVVDDVNVEDNSSVFESVPAEQSFREAGDSDGEGEQSSLMEVEGAVVDESCSNYAMAQLSNQRDLYGEHMHADGPGMSLCVDDEEEEDDEEDDGFRAFNQDDVEPKYGVGMVELAYDPQEREERLVVAASKKTGAVSRHHRLLGCNQGW
eukprot:comp22307_c0_seq1/m.33117 comp22307_c0_seq1/g.33117  ORF comp22307_c0_seq1/g.33117 comp22307_c0_seq1/m.33117 type:complete len:621 (-) comp22307_c0_seq1:480-2342(-)